MRRKRGHFNQDIGLSKGGLTTKIHAVVDGLGNPLRIFLSPGNLHDSVPAAFLLEGLQADKLLADKAYDTNEILALAKMQNMQSIIPPKSRRIEQREYDKHTYKERHLVESFFEKLKEYRRISTRYDKLSVTFRAAALIA